MKWKTLFLSTSTKYRNPLHSPRSKSLWYNARIQLTVNILQKMDTQGDQHPWKRKMSVNLLNLSCCHRELDSVLQSGWVDTLNLQTRPSFSPDKHTRGVCSMCTRHLHIQSQHPHVTFTPQWQVVWLVTIYKRPQDQAVTVAIISDTGETSAPRWWKGAQWTN